VPISAIIGGHPHTISTGTKSNRIGSDGSPVTATTRLPRKGPIHRQVRAPRSHAVGSAAGIASSCPAVMICLHLPSEFCPVRCTMSLVGCGMAWCDWLS
jgi:hypothetical protein